MQHKCFPPVRTGILFALASFSCLFAQTNVLTQHNDISRTGQNLNETVLTPAAVTSGAFGKLFSMPVDGLVVAQPLYLSQLTIGGAVHNVAFVATEHDTVYAFDADTGAELWQQSMLTAAHGAAADATSEPASDTGCLDLPLEYGITGTPVIDPLSGTIYLETETFENGYPVQRLHALDVTTGVEKMGGPVVISATVAGTGSGSANGFITFDPKWENQRAGLLLLNGTVYVAFGAHCDFGPFHGWLMAYNAYTLQQTAVLMTTPNGVGSGIWMSGSGLAADMEGGEARLFLPTGNGTYDATLPYQTNTVDYGDDILRLNLGEGLAVEDAFTPKDQALRASSDTDLGSGGALILPDQPGPYPHLLVLSGKGSEIYLLDRDNLGGYSTTSNNVVQELDGQDTYMFGMPAYWNGNIYTWTSADVLRQFSLTNGLLSQTAVALGSIPPTLGEGSTPSISSNGSTGGILWAVNWKLNPQVMYAVDATNVANTLWTSATDAARDSAGGGTKWVIPTVSNGKVYVASAGSVGVYGLISGPDFALDTTMGNVTVLPGGSGAETINLVAANGFAGAVVLTASGLPPGATLNFAAASTGTAAIATFAAAAITAPGNYPITITGTSGALSHSTVVFLQVLSTPGFSLSATPASVAVQQSRTASSSIMIIGVNGFSGVPTLAISGLPSGLTAAFSPAAGASTLTLTAAANAWVGEFPVVVTGTYGSETETVSLMLSVTNGLTLTGVQMLNKATGVCADVNGISKAAGAGVGQASCWGGPNQLWNLSPVSTGVYQITSVNSGLVLDVSAASTSARAIAIQNTNNLLTSQQWAIQSTSDGYFTLVNVKSALCLDGVEASATSGDEIQQQPCSGSMSQKWSFTALSNTTTVNLAPWYNVNAISVNGLPTQNGGVDGSGQAFSSSTIGSGYSWYGYSFVFGPPGVPDAVRNATVSLPLGQYNGLYMLALASDGTQPDQTFVVNYSDGTSTTVVQGVHDWGNPVTVFTGEHIALTVPYRLTANGSEDLRPFNIYGYHFALDSTREIVSVTLPDNVNVCVMAMTLGK